MNLFGIIGLKDIVDILLVAGLMFYIYKLMKDTGTLNIFIGFLSFIIVWFLLAKVFDMQLIGAIMDKFTDAALFVIVVLFQDQIKRFFNEVGSHQRWRFLNKFLHKAENKDKQKWVMPVVYACMSMSKSKTGALIVIQQHMSLDDYARTGDVIDATINNRLLENIFFKNSPLHDGAVIIAGEKIEAAGCILPVSHDTGLPRYLGLRHRSALGISQATDAIAVVVSEETGNISYAYRGEMHLKLSSTELEHSLSALTQE